MSRISVMVLAAVAVLLAGLPDVGAESSPLLLLGLGATGWGAAVGALVRD